MFREMRRNRQSLEAGEINAILERNEYGVMSVTGDMGYPYGVPVNYVFYERAIYFHCAMEGYKLDSIRNNPKVSFCVVDADEVDSEKLTTRYRSVIVFGKAVEVADREEFMNALTAFGLKFNPDREKIKSEIRKDGPRTVLVKIMPEHMSGKEGLELLKERKRT